MCQIPGTEIVLPRKNIVLTVDAFPSIFPNLPKYLTSTMAAMKRNDPQERKRKYCETENQKFENWLTEDNFKTLEEVVLNQTKFRNEGWIIQKKNETLYFLKIIFQEIPKLKHILILDRRLNITVISDNVEISANRFEFVLGLELCCNSYGKLDNLLNAIEKLPENSYGITDRIEFIKKIYLLVSKNVVVTTSFQ